MTSTNSEVTTETALPWTGERFTPEIHGSIELEHMHRYRVALELATGKNVLDIACGEGYGTLLLSEAAHHVTGVDVSREAIEHARKKYQRGNISFKIGSCAEIPLQDNCIDIVVSFETIEHHDQHDSMMQEIKRVLRPDGLLIISSPDKYEYSVEADHENPFHVRELYRHEFEALLKQFFKNIIFYGQRVTYGSGIFPENVPEKFLTYNSDDIRLPATPGMLKPVYQIAIASDATPKTIPGSFLDQSIPKSEITNFWAGLVSQKDQAISDLNEDKNSIHRENLALQKLAQEAQLELSTLRDLLNEREADITRLQTEHQKNLSELLPKIAALKNVERELTEALHHKIDEMNLSIGEKERNTRIIARQVEDLRRQLSEILSSRSWKITTPLRSVSSRRHQISSGIKRRILRTYHELPISTNTRKIVKSIIFNTFGFALSGKATYRAWKEQKNIQEKWQDIIPATTASTQLLPEASVLPTANGYWEWSDYQTVKSCIAQIKSDRIAQAKHVPISQADIQGKNFIDIAKQIIVPQPRKEPDVSIILPVYNNIKYTLECLLSVTGNTPSTISYEIVVADDASTDETANILSKIPNLRVLSNKSNLGFLLNCNNALKHTNGRYVLYLNNDVQVTPGWLEALLGTFDSHPKAGAVGPKFVYPSGHLQEAGASFNSDGTAEMIGLNEAMTQPRFSYTRRVDYISGACLLMPASLAKKLKGFSEDFLPCYCEDSDLCLRIHEEGYFIYCNPNATIIHHLSVTTGEISDDLKLSCIAKNVNTLQNRWGEKIEKITSPRIIAFYLPQFHPFDENEKWWGSGFTEWTNVSKAKPNFTTHYQPRFPADLGYYDLRVPEVMSRQAELAHRYGINGFCFYYYWFGGKRLLERPVEQLLASGKPDFPFCLCWANENWTRRWDGQEHEVLMAQAHSPEDDEAVIRDLMRFFKDSRYIRVDERPLILIYRITLFPNFAATAARWREICRTEGIGEIYIAMVESFELVYEGKSPGEFGCDASVEFPPQGMGDPIPPTGNVINPDFSGTTADYRDLAVRYATRALPNYTRFAGIATGWDNTARRQNDSFCFENATPGAFQAWTEEALEKTRLQQFGDERLVFVNAWNEWAEGAYLEPDKRFGHTYLEAVRNAIDAPRLLRKTRYGMGNR